MWQLASLKPEPLAASSFVFPARFWVQLAFMTLYVEEGPIMMATSLKGAGPDLDGAGGCDGHGNRILCVLPESVLLHEEWLEEAPEPVLTPHWPEHASC